MRELTLDATGLVGLHSMPKTPSAKKPNEMPGLALAYMGDAVWEILVRERLLRQGEMKPDTLHRMATSFVKAKAQSDVLHQILPMLTEEEQSVLKRGRNAKSGSIPKNADVIDYRHATGFECLVGYLYLCGRFERLEELASVCLAYLEANTPKTKPPTSRVP